MEDWEQKRAKRKRENDAYILMTPKEKVESNIKGLLEEFEKLQLSTDLLNQSPIDTTKIYAYLKEKNIRIDCGQGRYHCIECSLSEIENNSPLISIK
jgi:uncharacterized protein (DUF1919 family)